MRRTFEVTVLLFSLVVAGCELSPSEGPAKRDAGRFIYDGEVTSPVLVDYPQVGTLETDQGSCTATQIAPNCILSADHCGKPKKFTLTNGDQSAISGWGSDRDQDILLASLESSLNPYRGTAIAFPTLEAQLPQKTLAPTRGMGALINVVLDVVGFGETGIPSDPWKRRVARGITGHGRDEVFLTYHAVCSGDSGGPGFEAGTRDRILAISRGAIRGSVYLACVSASTEILDPYGPGCLSDESVLEEELERSDVDSLLPLDPEDLRAQLRAHFRQGWRLDVNGKKVIGDSCTDFRRRDGSDRYLTWHVPTPEQVDAFLENSSYDYYSDYRAGYTGSALAEDYCERISQPGREYRLPTKAELTAIRGRYLGTQAGGANILLKRPPSVLNFYWSSAAADGKGKRLAVELEFGDAVRFLPRVNRCSLGRVDVLSRIDEEPVRRWMASTISELSCQAPVPTPTPTPTATIPYGVGFLSIASATRTPTPTPTVSATPSATSRYPEAAPKSSPMPTPAPRVPSGTSTPYSVSESPVPLPYASVTPPPDEPSPEPSPYPPETPATTWAPEPEPSPYPSDLSASDPRSVAFTAEKEAARGSESPRLPIPASAP